MRPRIDYHRVLEDFAYLGITGDALAERIGLRAGLLERTARSSRSAPRGGQSMAGDAEASDARAVGSNARAPCSTGA
jgi:hypothetical protein